MWTDRKDALQGCSHFLLNCPLCSCKGKSSGLPSFRIPHPLPEAGLLTALKACPSSLPPRTSATKEHSPTLPQVSLAEVCGKEPHHSKRIPLYSSHFQPSPGQTSTEGGCHPAAGQRVGHSSAWLSEGGTALRGGMGALCVCRATNLADRNAD